MSIKYNVLLINGPNISNMEIRDCKNYGCFNIEKLIQNLKIMAKKLNIQLNYFQSNSESKIIDVIYLNYSKTDFIICNPASLTHTSISLRDAFLAVKIPFIEIHISNIYSREKFRHKSYLSDISSGVICGFGKYVYYLALNAVSMILSQNKEFLNN